MKINLDYIFQQSSPIYILKHLLECYELPELKEVDDAMKELSTSKNTDVFIKILNNIFDKAKQEWSEIDLYFEKIDSNISFWEEGKEENWVRFVADEGMQNWNVLQDALNEIDYKTKPYVFIIACLCDKMFAYELK